MTHVKSTTQAGPIGEFVSPKTSDTCGSALEFDLWQQQALEPSRQQALTLHLPTCGACRARQAAQQHANASAAARLGERFVPQERKHRRPWRVWPIAAPVAALSCAVFLVVMQRSVPERDGIQLKGSAPTGLSLIHNTTNSSRIGFTLSIHQAGFVQIYASSQPRPLLVEPIAVVDRQTVLPLEVTVDGTDEIFDAVVCQSVATFDTLQVTTEHFNNPSNQQRFVDQQQCIHHLARARSTHPLDGPSP